MKAALIAVAVLVLLACSGNPPAPFAGPNGRPAYSVSCSGLGNVLDRCYRRASELCPNGYTVIDRSQDVEQGTTIRQRLVVECKA